MAATARISVTDINSFLDCRLAWHFSSPLRMNLMPSRPYAPFVLGRGVHHAIDAVHKSRGARTYTACYDEWATEEVQRLNAQPLTEESAQQMQEALDLGRVMLDHYALWLERFPPAFRIVETEFKLQVPLGETIEGRKAYFVGRVDGLAVDREGRLLLLEYKTTQRLQQEPELALDFQGLAYLAAARQLGAPPGERTDAKGVVYTFLLKKAPKLPKLLQSGALSTDKRQGTSYELYTKALEERGLNPADYASVLLFLDTSCQYFQRYTMLPTPKALEMTWESLKAVAREMLSPHPPIYPHPGSFGWKCERCWFREPCDFYRQGIDPMPVLRAGFQQRQEGGET